MASEPAAEAAARLADRLRELRERGLGRRLTQTELGQAFPEEVGGTASAATISMWENPASGRTVPHSRVEGYARLFCTPRSLPDEGSLQMIEPGRLTDEEHDRLEELREELLDLREHAIGGQGALDPKARTVADHGLPGSEAAQSMWHFPDRSRITLVCGRLPAENLPPHASRGDLNYVRFAGLADLDALIDIYGAIRAHNPTSRVVIMAPEDLNQRDVANHLVVIGGIAWNAITPWLSRIFPVETFPVPIDAEDSDDRRAIVVPDPGGGEHEFKYTITGGHLVEDVGMFGRGPNPTAPERTLTICSGITTRGVHGAAKCFIDKEMKQRNERYLHSPRFPDGSTYCIVMRVPVVNESPLTPDLSRADNLLYEWCDDPRFEAE
jgi:hypothetical protein